ncbi:5-oxoprolinase subunit PxpA [Streptomyces chartreusis]|uniref:LamB/YcsF family protein n=1 Tax=Streptomyces chartreusis TaxID=1969 RepID=UPI0033CEC706
MTEPPPCSAPVIDLNSDLGEGFGPWRMADDDALLEIVTSANVACGFHAGDPATMRRVCAKAAENGVTIGAHIGYRDLAGFGRRPLAIAPHELVDDVLYQIAALDGFARVAGTRVRYVKAHGALYNTVTHDPEQAAALAEAVHRYDPSLALLGLPGSQGLRHAEARGLRTVQEGFADRAYTADGRLVPRGQPHAVIHSPEEIVQRGIGMALTGKVTADDGTLVTVTARSLCVHGDTPGAVAAASALRAGLLAAGAVLAPFTSEGAACAS